jgi:hypothetical protein
VCEALTCARCGSAFHYRATLFAVHGQGLELETLRMYGNAAVLRCLVLPAWSSSFEM